MTTFTAHYFALTLEQARLRDCVRPRRSPGGGSIDRGSRYSLLNRVTLTDYWLANQTNDEAWSTATAL